MGGEPNQPVVGAGDAVRVAGQVVENMQPSAEGRLGINKPVFAEQRPRERAKCLVLCQRFQGTGQTKLVVAAGSLQTGEELAADCSCRLALCRANGRRGEQCEYRGSNGMQKPGLAPIHDTLSLPKQPTAHSADHRTGQLLVVSYSSSKHHSLLKGTLPMAMPEFLATSTMSEGL